MSTFLHVNSVMTLYIGVLCMLSQLPVYYLLKKKIDRKSFSSCLQQCQKSLVKQWEAKSSGEKPSKCQIAAKLNKFKGTVHILLERSHKSSYFRPNAYQTDELIRADDQATKCRAQQCLHLAFQPQKTPNCSLPLTTWGIQNVPSFNKCVVKRLKN